MRAIKPLALPLLVPWVRADDQHDALPANYPAALTHRLYGRPYLHRPSWVVSIKNLREKALPHHESRGGHNETARRPARKYSNPGVIPTRWTAVGRPWPRMHRMLGSNGMDGGCNGARRSRRILVGMLGLAAGAAA